MPTLEVCIGLSFLGIHKAGALILLFRPSSDIIFAKTPTLEVCIGVSFLGVHKARALILLFRPSSDIIFAKTPTLEVCIGISFSDVYLYDKSLSRFGSIRCALTY
jgi:hypothetical protein